MQVIVPSPSRLVIDAEKVKPSVFLLVSSSKRHPKHKTSHKNPC